jgi:hypothetical protein
MAQMIISDRGLEFNSKTWVKELNKIHIIQQPTSSYHPQADGLADQRIQSLLKNMQPKKE